MSFIAGSIIIGSGMALAGAGIAAKGSKDAAKIASAGSDKEIAYNRESRDIALDLGSPYREAGYSALDQLGLMTGLLDSGGSFGRPSYQGEGAAVTGEGTPWGDSPWKLGFEDGKYTATYGEDKLFWDDSSQQWMNSTGSAYGSTPKSTAPMGNDFSEGSYNAVGRAGGGVLYNVNELGPESIYSGGSITRSSNPKTMPPDPRGYVHPNIQGRAIGGAMYNPTYDMSEGSYAATGAQRSAVNPGSINPNSMGDSVQRGAFGNVRNTNLGFGGINKGGEFGYRDGIPSNKENMPSSTYGAGGAPGGLYSNISPQPGTPAGNSYDMIVDANGGPDAYQDYVEGNNYFQNDQGGYPTPQENPYDFTTDPGYIFRFNEGMRALEGSAAARGGLLSGGFGRKAIRYGQDYATGEFTNIYNRLSNIAGLGQVSAGQGGVFAQNAGQNMGAAAGQGAMSSAYGQQGATNAWSNAFNEIAQLPWDQIQWGGNSTTPTSGRSR